jgi:tetratricopeptide (TPR) repeat protein
MRRRGTCLAGVALAALAGAGAGWAQTTNHTHYEPAPPQAAQPGPEGQLAPRLQNLGTYAFPVTTRSRRAQQFFNQGLNLAYGFNHAEAGRAFKEAARLDPRCAMAYWGQALVLGPNINVPMEAAAEPLALELAQKAVALRKGATARERAYIDALARRYTGRAADRASADRAYADAMSALARRYPADLDAATLYAEALMDLRPWDYWLRDGTAQPGTLEAIALLESVLKRQPGHPGANHLYIHLLEPTDDARRAEKAADRLLPLMPGAGHMVHMPSHIYMRVGRYADAAAANEKAILADEDYIAQCRAQGVYPLGYYPHNIHFLWWAATFQGRGRTAVEAALKTASKVPPEALKDLPFLQAFLVVPYWAWTRFERWDDILGQAAPAADTLFARGVWHYARGRALAARGRLDEAEVELAKLRAIVADPELPRTPATFSTNTPDGVLRVAPEVLAGDLAARRGDFPRALAHLETAVRHEDALNYTEPADWHFPVRQALAAVLMQAGRAAEAEVVYWEDLRRNPENGWSLLGLARSLEAQGKDAPAAAARERFKKAWSQADVTLDAPRF